MVKLTLIKYDSKLWKICEMPNNQDLTRIYDLGDQLSITVGIWEHMIIKTWNNLFYKIQDQNPKIWFVFRDWRNKLHYFFLGFYWFSSLDLFLIEKKTPLWALTPTVWIQQKKLFLQMDFYLAQLKNPIISCKSIVYTVDHTIPCKKEAFSWMPNAV